MDGVVPGISVVGDPVWTAAQLAADRGVASR